MILALPQSVVLGSSRGVQTRPLYSSFYPGGSADMSRYDALISQATEDKDSLAEPLAVSLMSRISPGPARILRVPDASRCRVAFLMLLELSMGRLRPRTKKQLAALSTEEFGFLRARWNVSSFRPQASTKPVH
jgi:hypothetical protein